MSKFENWINLPKEASPAQIRDSNDEMKAMLGRSRIIMDNFLQYSEQVSSGIKKLHKDVELINWDIVAKDQFHELLKEAYKDNDDRFSQYKAEFVASFKSLRQEMEQRVSALFKDTRVLTTNDELQKTLKLREYDLDRVQAGVNFLNDRADTLFETMTVIEQKIDTKSAYRGPEEDGDEEIEYTFRKDSTVSIQAFDKLASDVDVLKVKMESLATTMQNILQQLKVQSKQGKTPTSSSLSNKAKTQPRITMTSSGTKQTITSASMADGKKIPIENVGKMPLVEFSPLGKNQDAGVKFRVRQLQGHRVSFTVTNVLEDAIADDNNQAASISGLKLIQGSGGQTADVEEDIGGPGGNAGEGSSKGGMKASTYVCLGEDDGMELD